MKRIFLLILYSAVATGLAHIACIALDIDLPGNNLGDTIELFLIVFAVITAEGSKK